MYDQIRASLEAFVPLNEQEAQDKRVMLHDMQLFPDLLTRENEIMHFTASCWITNPERTRALMAFHNLYQSWAWLGGHADGDGDLLRVALREAREESGVQAQADSPEPFSVEILGVDAHVRRGRHVCTHLHLNLTYLLTADEHAPIRRKPDENSAVRWFALDEILSAVSEPEMKPVYQKLIARCRLR